MKMIEGKNDIQRFTGDPKGKRLQQECRDSYRYVVTVLFFSNLHMYHSTLCIYLDPLYSVAHDAHLMIRQAMNEMETEQEREEAETGPDQDEVPPSSGMVEAEIKDAVAPIAEIADGFGEDLSSSANLNPGSEMDVEMEFLDAAS
jgi:hypothetical protein